MKVSSIVLVTTAVICLSFGVPLAAATRSGTTLPVECFVNVSKDVPTGSLYGFTKKQKQEILDLHNQYRYDISSKASSMILLQWNEALSKSAEKALAALSGASPCATTFSAWSVADRTNLDGFDIVGQNLLTYSQTEDRATFPIKHWGSYSQNYTWGTCASSKNKNMCGTCTASDADCLSYTQVIWANSKDVGCASKFCGSKHAYFTCLYGPAGNVQGQEPYAASTVAAAKQQNSCQNPQATPLSAPEEEASWKKPVMYAGAFLGVIVAGSFFYVMTNDDCSCCESDTKTKEQKEKEERQRRQTFSELDGPSSAAFVAMEEQQETLLSNRSSPQPEGASSARGSPTGPHPVTRDASGNVVAATSLSRSASPLAASPGGSSSPSGSPQRSNPRSGEGLSPAQEETKARLTAYFTKYNPIQIQQIPVILEKFAGKEDKMWRALTNKYGPE